MKQRQHGLWLLQCMYARQAPGRDRASAVADAPIEWGAALLQQQQQQHSTTKRVTTYKGGQGGRQMDRDRGGGRETHARREIGVCRERETDRQRERQRQTEERGTEPYLVDGRSPHTISVGPPYWVSPVSRVPSRRCE